MPTIYKILIWNLKLIAPGSIYNLNVNYSETREGIKNKMQGETEGV
jgi:hypothetical protein